MKYSSTHEVYKTLRQCYSVYATPKLIAEWNFNRLRVAHGDNDPEDSYYGQDSEMFPPGSMREGLRPGKGIIKARVGEGRIAWDYFDDPTSVNRSHGEGDRYYIASTEDIYKYWSSPEPANASGNWPFHTDGTQLTARPWVDYDDQCEANKIVIGLENTWSSPLNYTVWVGRHDVFGELGTWEQVASQSNTTIDSEGRIVLYYDGSWFGVDESDPNRKMSGPRVAAARHVGDNLCAGPSADYGPTDTIIGVQLRVSQMDKPDAYLNVIELSARLERDLTDFLVSAEDTFDIAESSQTHPIGKITSNIGSVVLSNQYFIFNNENPESPFYQMLDANTRFNLEYIFNTGQFGAATTSVQQFEMWSEIWGGQLEETVTVELRDASKFLQEIKPRKALYENYTVAEIVWTVCDSVGFDYYKIEKRDDDPANDIDIFWIDGEKTVWEIFSELCEATQTAIYFDGYGLLHVKTRRTAFNESLEPDWNIYGNDPVAGMMTDLMTVDKSAQYEANHVTVSYQTTKWSEWNRGMPNMEIVWEPEETVTLRATELQRELNIGDEFIWIDPKEAQHWPYEGIVNIQGELIRFNGKQFRYYTSPTSKHTRVINSREEKRNFDPETPQLQQHKNGWTGGLRIEKRGLWNSEPKRHFVEANHWNIHAYRNGDRKLNAKGFRHFKKLSQVRLHTSKKWKGDDWLLATRGEDDDAGYYYYGTRMNLAKEAWSGGGAGIVFHNSGIHEAGYYIEVVPTASLNGPKRAQRNEVMLYVRRDDGTRKKLGAKIEGQASIVKGNWFDIDVEFRKDVGPDNDHEIFIEINGRRVIEATVSGADRATWGGKFGMFVHGNCFADYEYFYAISRNDPVRPDESQYFDRLKGDYASAQWDREWVYALRPRKRDRITKKDNDKDKERFAGRLMDEFGPFVHEVREFNVKFDPMPVLHSRLYFSNDWAIVCPEYRSDAFSAQFILGNSVRVNAIVNGEDSLLFGSENPVNQRLLVFGRALITKDAQTVVAKNEELIERRGRIEAEIASPWIQSKSQAQRLADWIRDHWAGSTDEMTVEVFGNPLIEIGDIVSMESDIHAFEPLNSKYFVLGTATTFSEGGLATTLTLRKVVS